MTNQAILDVASFPYDGPEALRQPIATALSRVVDPEISMSIVDVGLIYGVTVDAKTAHVLITMTSAACPVIDVIIEDAELELDKVIPADLRICIELVWEPPWTPKRMSAKAKRFMGW
ncbi:metal-sulfur cluster assembly factor [Variovorax sp. J22G21]|uniref:metal-sulfur cluster assembly factor n=1 Tax=Variovorax fucosicus TaxID=3053517 RepID=UPI002577472E|nr:MULTISPECIES: metal-sulfur cluster assembly factor [unclassified Variovorax]MDM0037574.1 metal-sulfur cluster assembly factor [Variovorax sp. J22R193]MDM0062350.1 metal-sulfur cluster assembly factor [Variovorax sp. J22G21]